MKKYLIIPLCLLLFGNLSAQTTLTLEEAISIALQRNTNLIKSKNNLSATEKQVLSAYGDLLPSLGANGNWRWTKITNDEGLGQQVVNNEVRNDVATEVDTRYYNVEVGGNVTLFNGLSNWANVSRRNDELESAQLTLKRLKQDIVFQTTDYYYTVLNAEELLNVRQDNVEYNKKLLETIQERNRLGSVAIADVYAQQVQLGNAELALIQAQNAYETAKNNILNYLSVDVLEEYIFVNPQDGRIDLEDELERQYTSVEDMVKEAMRTRYDYQSQLYNVEAANSGVTIARGSFFPSLTGNYGYSTDGNSAGDLFEEHNWSAGLTLSIPIFSNFNRFYNVELAQVQYKNQQEDLRALERAIKIDIKQGYLDYSAAKKQLEVATKNVQSAEENRRINNERYGLGSGTILDVLQADRDYTQALRDRIDAEFNFYRTQDNLLNALGKLDFKQYEK